MAGLEDWTILDDRAWLVRFWMSGLGIEDLTLLDDRAWLVLEDWTILDDRAWLALEAWLRCGHWTIRDDSE